MKPIHSPLILSILAFLAALAGCSKPGPAATAAAGDIDYYTCAMHPSVRSQDPDAKCPICGMDLVPVKKADAQAKPAGAGPMAAKGGDAADQPHEFTIPVDRQQLIGVTYATVETTRLKRTLRAAGLVAATTTGHWDYVARVDGYVHNLNVAAPGDAVKKGQILLDLYSPDVVATENEYADLVRMRANGRGEQNAAATQSAEHLLSGARARLRQWNISDEQIDAVEKSGAAEEFIPLSSPVNGIVKEVAAQQGRRVSAGDRLVELVDLSSIWVWAEFYENELPLLKPGLPVIITSPAQPNRPIPGKIAVVDPFLNDMKRTGRVRIDVDNPAGGLRPDAYVDVSLALDEGEGLTVPVDSVLPTGERNVVFVDKGAGLLEPRFVQLGGKFGDVYRVAGGLRAGERVVSSANFLVDAESKVQGALKSW